MCEHVILKNIALHTQKKTPTIICKACYGDHRVTWISWSPLNLQNVLVNSLLFLAFDVNFFQLSSKQPKLVFSFLLFCYSIHFPEVFSELSASTSTTSQCQLRGRTMSPQFHLGSLYKTVKEREKKKKVQQKLPRGSQSQTDH